MKLYYYQRPDGINNYRFANEAWNRVCQEINFGYIDPRWSTEKILSCIDRTEVLLAEAMHGAIVADALRVQWIPIVTHDMIHKFKWQDWCQSVGLEYRPIFLTPVYSSPEKTNIFASFRSLKSWLRQKLVISQMLRIAKTSRPFLSSDARIEQLTVRLEEKLQQLRTETTSS